MSPTGDLTPLSRPNLVYSRDISSKQLKLQASSKTLKSFHTQPRLKDEESSKTERNMYTSNDLKQRHNDVDNSRIDNHTIVFSEQTKQNVSKSCMMTPDNDDAKVNS